MLHVISLYMFYNHIFRYIKHTVIVHEPFFFRKSNSPFNAPPHCQPSVCPSRHRSATSFLLENLPFCTSTLLEEVLPPASLSFAVFPSHFLSEPSYSDLSVADLSMLRLFSNFLYSEIPAETMILAVLKLNLLLNISFPNLLFTSSFTSNCFLIRIDIRKSKKIIYTPHIHIRSFLKLFPLGNCKKHKIIN